jgi:hypothetical protein
LTWGSLQNNLRSVENPFIKLFTAVLSFPAHATPTLPTLAICVSGAQETA